MNVTDRQILHGGIGRDYAQHRAAKIDYVNLSTVRIRSYIRCSGKSQLLLLLYET